MSEENLQNQVDPDDIDENIYDKIENLEKLQDLLSDLISNNEISQEKYDDEMLKTRYYLDTMRKTYIIDPDDEEIIKKLREYKSSLNENYVSGLIGEEEFNREYIKTLRKEYEILKFSEEEPEEKEVELDLPLEETLIKIEEQARKYYKRIAKKYDLEYPKIPYGVTNAEIQEYYKMKLDRRESYYDDRIEEYMSKMKKVKEFVDFRSSSYEVLKRIYNPITKKLDYEYKAIPSRISKVSDIQRESKEAVDVNRLLPFEEDRAFAKRQITLKNKLRKLTREDLLRCVGARTFKFMSYIERLRENKQPVIKFRENTSEKSIIQLRKIVEEENLKFYKINSEYLFRDYVYTLPTVNEANVYELPEETSTYTQAGSVIYLAFPPGIKKGDDVSDLDKMISVKPLPDELYNFIKDKNGDLTDISTVLELRTSLPGTDKKIVTKRFLDFNDYLKELREILIANSKVLFGKSRDILNEKIRKISYYIKYDTDLENILPTGQLSLSEVFKKTSDIITMRKNGLYKLSEFINPYYPGSKATVDKIEFDIYNYSSSNYEKNIDKVIFILKNYFDKFEDLMTGSETITALINFETPMITPEDDLDFSNKESTIEYLLSWKPNTDMYDRYSSELQNNNHNFSKFKKDNQSISSLELNQIMSQYSEKITWERSLRDYNFLEVPDGYISTNYKLRYLIRCRNRLPSRRIYRVATIDKRILTQSDIKSVFKTCNVQDPDKQSVVTEEIIYTMSKIPQDYIYYSSIIKEQYRKLCSFIGKQTDITTLTRLITEFLITEGELETADVNKIMNFMNVVGSNNITGYVNSLRGDDLEIYHKTLLAEVNETGNSLSKIYEKAVNILRNNLRNFRMEKLRIIAVNTYKPPIVSKENPEKIIAGVKYSPEYIKIEDLYIYGGNYPMFNMYNDSGEIVKQNYTRSDLENLAILFNIELVEDDFELYKSIVTFIENYNKKEIQVNRINYNPVEYSDYFEYLKMPVTTISYIIRPRLGVEEPGEVYEVTKDPYLKFGVPFDFDENTIPIYSSELKPLVDNSFIIIEGPCIFKDTFPGNKVTTDSYIIIEYTDSRGKTKKFREGVSPKKIIKRQLDQLDTCKRFLTKDSCDNINSYSIKIKNLKLKCKWLNNACSGVIAESDALTNFDMKRVKFNEKYKNELWSQATNKSIDYLEELTKQKELTKEEISLLIKEQKLRLYNYFNTLLQDKPAVQEINEEDKLKTRSYSLISEFEVLQNFDKKLNMEYSEDEYQNITLYKEEITEQKIPLKTINMGQEYTINELTVIPYEFTEDLKVSATIKGTDDTVTLEREEFRKSGKPMLLKKPVFCKIHKENVKFLKDFPGYYWTLIETDLVTTRNEILQGNKETIKTFVPLNFIIPTDEINGSPLVTKADIFSAMYKTAYCKLKTADEIIYDITEKINANEDAIKFSIERGVDIIKIKENTIGTVTLFNVLEEFERLRPRVIKTANTILQALRDGIDKKDKKILINNYALGRRANLDKKFMKEVKDLIKTLPDPAPEEPVKKKIEKPQEPKTGTSKIYGVSRRR